MKTSETLQLLKDTLTAEQYKAHTDSITELTILPQNLTQDELFQDYSEYSYYTLRVTKRNRETYAVMEGRFNSVYSKAEDEDFIHEGLPSGREDEFIANTRFSLEEAVAIAETEVEKIILMGRNLEEMRTLLSGEVNV